MRLFLNLTKRCNFNCSYCYERDKQFMDGRMSFETAQKALDFFLPRMDSSDVVHFFGGEPLLVSKLTEKVLPHIRQRNTKVSIFINTNGSLLNRNILTLFTEARVDLALSFDGSPGTQNHNRPFLGEKKDSYSAVVNSDFFDLLVNYPRLEVNVVVSQGKVGRLFRDFLHLINLGFRNINFDAERGVYWPPKKLEILQREFRKINYFYFFKNSHHVQVGNIKNYFKKMKSNTITSRCPHKSRVVIMPTGDIYSCNAILTARTNQFTGQMKVMSVDDLKNLSIEEFLRRKNNVHFSACGRLNEALGTKDGIICDALSALQDKINFERLSKNEKEKTDVFRKSTEFFLRKNSSKMSICQ